MPKKREPTIGYQEWRQRERHYCHCEKQISPAPFQTRHPGRSQKTEGHRQQRRETRDKKTVSDQKPVHASRSSESARPWAQPAANRTGWRPIQRTNPAGGCCARGRARSMTATKMLASKLIAKKSDLVWQ